MKYAAFFRNLNLGRANCPDRAQFEQAFLDAGAIEASSFLTNGTLVFRARPRAGALSLLARAAKILHAGCGLREPGFLRPLDDLADMVTADPFAQVDRATVYECCVSFLHADIGELPPVPVASRRRDVEILRFTPGAAFSLSRKIGNSPGSPNAFLEKLLGLPATTRNWNTVVRLVQKHA